jgi:hypothetical protein
MGPPPGTARGPLVVKGDVEIGVLAKKSSLGRSNDGVATCSNVVRLPAGIKKPCPQMRRFWHFRLTTHGAKQRVIRITPFVLMKHVLS